MQSFTYGEFAALALARVWAGRAHIPDTEELWRLYWKRVEDRGGHTKRLQFLGGERTEGQLMMKRRHAREIHAFFRRDREHSLLRRMAQ
jgi:hypothetical protein